MTVVPMVIGKYIYTQDDFKGGSQAVDVHHISVQRERATTLLLYLAILPVVSYISSLVFFKEQPGDSFFWNLLLSIFVFMAWSGKTVKKECIVIMPGFGVQLETHYKSGKVNRQFVPIGSILKPVLYECVTPFSCCWSLALILRGEAELKLVFQELQPPVRMLVPVWKALCGTTDSKNESDG